MLESNAQALERLTAATTGIDLTAGEQRTLEWISGWEAHTVENVARVIEKARGSLTRHDLLTVWGYMETLKNIFTDKAKDAAQRGDAIGDKLTSDYMRMGAEISALQSKLNTEAENRRED